MSTRGGSAAMAGMAGHLAAPLTKAAAVTGGRPFYGLDCSETIHTWDPSCVSASVGILKYVYGIGVQVYGPLYLLQWLYQRRSLRDLLTRTAPSVLRSSAFLAAIGGSFVTFECLLRRAAGYQALPLAGCGGFCCSLLAILIERKKRRSELALYCVSQSVEAGWRSLAAKGYVPLIPGGDVAAFSAAAAALGYLWESDRDAVPGTMQTVMRLVLGEAADAADDAAAAAGGDGGGAEEGGDVAAVRRQLARRRARRRQALRRVLRALLRGLAIGFAVSLATRAFRLRRAGLSSRVFWELVSPERHLSYAGFVGLFAGGYAAVRHALAARGKGVAGACAGAVAGLSIMLTRSSDLSGYVASRAAEALFRAAVARGYCRSHYHGDSLIFALCCAVIIHVAAYEPHHLRSSYWGFLLKFSPRFADINRTDALFLGWESTKLLHESHWKRRGAPAVERLL